MFESKLSQSKAGNLQLCLERLDLEIREPFQFKEEKEEYRATTV